MAPSKVAILSIGEMGLGIAKLLTAHSFPVLTSLEGRTQATAQRAAAANIQLFDTDAALMQEADVVLSIVPPRDAAATVQRVIAATKNAQRRPSGPLCLLDLNAISPSLARENEKALRTTEILFLDGGIIGGPPRESVEGKWHCPSLVVSGSQELRQLRPDGEQLATVLNLRHVGLEVGTASGLKMCFASLTKGLTAIAIQSFTTAHSLGVLDDLQNLLQEYSPKTGDLAAKGLVGMPPKAYRWVGEMQQIAMTMREEGGFVGNTMFDEVAQVYETIADDTLLGQEKTESRRRGKTPEDVAILTREGILQKAEKQAQ